MIRNAPPARPRADPPASPSADEGAPFWLVYGYLAAVLIPVQLQIGTLLLTPLRLYLLLVLPLLCLHLLRRPPRWPEPADVLLLLFFLWSGVALAVNSPGSLVESLGSTALEALGGYMFARLCIRTPQDFVTLCRALLGIAMGLLLLAGIETALRRPFLLPLLDRLPGLTALPVVDYPARLGLHRVQGVFPHPILFGLFCAGLFSLCLVALRDEIPTWLRRLAAVAIFACTFLSLSAGPLFTLLCQLGLLGWALGTKRLKARWWGLIALCALGYLAIDLLSNRTPLRVFMSHATFSAQTAYYRAAINEWGAINILQNPVFGLGLRDWIRPDWMVSPSIDSFWLVTAMRSGLPGLLLLMAAFLIALIRIARRPFGAEGRLFRLRRGWCFSMAGLFLGLLTVDIWGAVFSFLFFLFGAGLWLHRAPAEGADGPARVLRRVGPLRYSRFPARPPARLSG